MGNFQHKSFYQSITGDFSPGLKENRMNNQVTGTQQHLWPWLHNQSAVVLPASPHLYQTFEMTTLGLQKALPIITMIMVTARISFWGLETQNFLCASPCSPLFLEVLKLAWATLPPSHRSPRGSGQIKVKPSHCSPNKGITCNSWSPEAELAQTGYRGIC